MVELKGSPEGQVESSAADSLEGVGEGAEALAAEAFGPDHDTCACDQARDDAAYRADPVIVDGPLEEEGGGNQKSDDADAAEKLGADPVFERTIGFGKVAFEVWRSGFCE